MLVHCARGTVLALCFATGCAAGELAEFNAAVELAQAEVTVGLEGAHAKLLGAGECLAVVLLG